MSLSLQERDLLCPAQAQGQTNPPIAGHHDIAVTRRKLPDLRRDLEITDPDLARRTLEIHIGKFLETLTGAKSTVYNIRHAIELMLADWPKDSPRILSKIRKGDCERWLAKYGDLAASTVNTRISAASKFFELAMNDGAIPRSPMDGITYRRRALQPL